MTLGSTFRHNLFALSDLWKPSAFSTLHDDEKGEPLYKVTTGTTSLTQRANEFC